MSIRHLPVSPAVSPAHRPADPMGIFCTNRRLLDRLIMQPDGAIDPVDAAKVRAYLEMMQTERRKSDGPVIPYSDHHCRIAYDFNYFTMHAGIVEFMLRHAPGLLQFCCQQIASNGNLNACAFGGGPGPETLALARMVDWHPKMRGASLDVTVVDCENHWNDSHRVLVQEINAAQRMKYGRSASDWAVTVHRGFMSFDMLKPQEFRNSRTTFRDQNLIIVNYVISEICRSEELRRLVEVLTVIGEMAAVGTRLLVVDRLLDHQKVSEVLQGVDYWSVTSKRPLSGFTLDPAEDKTELDPYIRAFERFPSLRRDIIAVAAQKVHE